MNEIQVSVNVIDIKGKNATVRVERVITCEPDMPAEVSNVGTEQDVRLEFVIPKGIKGDTGDISDELVALGEQVRADKNSVNTSLNKVIASENQCSLYSGVCASNAREVVRNSEIVSAKAVEVSSSVEEANGYANQAYQSLRSSEAIEGRINTTADRIDDELKIVRDYKENFVTKSVAPPLSILEKGYVIVTPTLNMI